MDVDVDESWVDLLFELIEIISVNPIFGMFPHAMHGICKLLKASN